MNKVHKTREGVRMFISEMDDNHLQNFIKLQLRAIDKIKNTLRGQDNLDPFKKAMYSIEEQDVEELTEMLENICELLYPYLAEIALRGINMSKELQDTFERTTNNLISNDIDDEYQLLLDNLA